MKRRDFLSGLGAAFFFLWANHAYSASMCIETGDGGSLTPGKLSRDHFEALLKELQKAPQNASLFVVQNDDGYYGKVCNTRDQIEHFEKRNHPNKWKGGEKMTKDQIYKMISEHGVIRVNKTPGGLSVYI